MSEQGAASSAVPRVPAILPALPDFSIAEQIRQGKADISSKRPVHSYIAYFQAFTNTYAPVETLRALYMEAIADPEVKILSIATRPDCLGADVLALLDEINQIKPVWVELGLQTIHPENQRLHPARI